MSLFERFKGNRPMYIIAGLGNPGSKYENTRHNIGWLAIDELAKEQGVTVDRMKFHALTGQCVLAGEKVLLMKPTTFMNNSGEAIEEARNFYKIPTGNVIVLSDDINLAPGKMRIRRKGGSGGHNGLKSIIQCMGTEDFPRVRLGIGGKTHPDMDLADYVLGKFPKSEQKAIDDVLKNAAEAAELLVAGDVNEAMNRFN
ncbi:MAG: aminoacyl-tRNA hydrolase [Clostridia bacterium]|nr:aminoacyl-tRNA hydrolase [Clostridia bacterium]MBQ8469676.1 aminoacyl-tRNA hydrolase [Clostridia bacterium]MBR1704250.1 aminoacyl-tRNA hydrolase [Clostridia bacterium]